MSSATAPLVVYGLASCDTCRKARRWLAAEGLAHRFHDLRAEGVPADRLAAWLREPGAEAMVNRRSTTWRQLSEAERAQAATAAGAAALLAARPTLIKRPVFDLPDGRVLVGFGAAQQAALRQAGSPAAE